jgi:hypothetical protein
VLEAFSPAVRAWFAASFPEPTRPQIDAVNAWLAHAGTWETLDPANVAASLGGTSNASHLAGVLLAAALTLVLLETVLARWFSHAGVTELTKQSGIKGEGFGSGLAASARQASSLKPQTASS